MRAIISVSDKAGIVHFAEGLQALGCEILSTGGTYKVLKQNGIKVMPVESVTGFPEMMDGRLKTLHPKIHGGILAVRDNKEHIHVCEAHNIPLIDLVIVNLYPFEKTISKPMFTLEEAMENIDIGGPTMLRAAAKNYKHVGVVVNPDKYELILSELKAKKGSLTLPLKEELAWEAFQHTARYDTIITGYLRDQVVEKNRHGFPSAISPMMTKIKDLRYGENPHQKAGFYKLLGTHHPGLAGLKQLHGKELSYNNYLDLEAAWQVVKTFDLPGAAVIKHTNPCGAAISDTLEQAYERAYQGDPVSAFGSIVGLNRTVDKPTAERISQTFVEAVIAPDFDRDALDILTSKPSIRLIRLLDFNSIDKDWRFRYVSGGFLVQDPDTVLTTKADLTYCTKTKPAQKQINDLLFGLSVVKHVKSNAIVVVKDGQVIGVGAGQMNRVKAVEIALQKAENQADGAVLASDAFFPFKDSVELAVKAGISAIIQPGGSKRDIESIESCDEHGIAMVYTGVRHFKH
ncbi:bifunctional phosphoribosylaminoimidazolecarboxamide formyltransferase/IMP cyclohydrolase [Thermoproteota archaeon]